MLNMQRLLGLLLILAVFSACCIAANDDDFAEFEEFDEDEFELPIKQQNEPKKNPSKSNVVPNKDEDQLSNAADDFQDDGFVQVEEFDNEQFEPFDEDSSKKFAGKEETGKAEDSFDDEEFEGIEVEEVPRKTQGQEELKFAKVPVSLHRDWSQYYLELTLLFGMFIYFVNFLLGRSKNSTLAQAWFKANKEILEANFSIVGDDGSGKEPLNGILMKESDHSYVMWCSGRIGVEGMLVQLKWIKRQDLINTIQRIVRPAVDQIKIQVIMEKEDMDSYIFCLAQKKSAAKLHKDINDLALYIEGKKSGEDYKLSSSYQVLSEIGEATKHFLLDNKFQAFMEKHEGCLDYMHFSDQYSGEKAVDENEQKKMPEATKSLIFCFNVGKRGVASSKDLPLTQEWLKLVLYFVEKARRFELSREGKLKAEKNRQRVLESYNKLAHQQRTELAQQRREEKLRAETERYMKEEDPVKARKLEEKRAKKEQQKKLQKMKAIKIKAA